jgi:hypothetical protein
MLIKNWRVESTASVYPKLLEWWESRSFPPIPLENLPKELFIIYTLLPSIEDVLILPIYTTGTATAWLGFPTINPHTSLSFEQKSEMFTYGIDTVSTVLKYHGCNLLITTTNLPVVSKYLESSDFTVTDENVNFYIKNIY